MINEATQCLQDKLKTVRPTLGIILGSGLGSLVSEMEETQRVSYKEIPHLPESTVAGHAGEFVYGKWNGHFILVLSGRLHLYEGYEASTVVLPVQIMACMGIKALIVINAAGAVNTSYRPGELMLIHDHINLQGTHPLIGPNKSSLGFA